MQIDHIEFEIESLDEHGYPVVVLDAEGHPVVKKVTPHKIPYLKKEVLDLFKYVNNNKDKLLNNGH